MNIELSDNDYIMLRDLIRRGSGLNLARIKRELIASRLLKRLRVLHLYSFHDYYDIAVRDREEFTNLIDSITTNKTEFFREPKQFDFFRKTVLPEIAASASEERNMRIWSAGCSTGEEPYSIAMSIAEDTEGAARWDVKILASDICAKALKTAEQGIYEREKLASLNPFLLQKYFLMGIGVKQGLFQVKQCLRELILFRKINLVAEAYPVKGMFDAIFCRNVIIYFDRPTQNKVITAILKYLKPGGYLFCGHSETLLGFREWLRMVHPCVYRKDA